MHINSFYSIRPILTSMKYKSIKLVAALCDVIVIVLRRLLRFRFAVVSKGISNKRLSYSGGARLVTPTFLIVIWKVYHGKRRSNTQSA